MTTTEAEKELKLAITDVNFYPGGFAIRCKLDLEVETGDGDTIEFTGDNNSPWTLYRACGGAVVRAVAEMLNHPNILYYLQNQNEQFGRTIIPDLTFSAIPTGKKRIVLPRALTHQEKGVTSSSL